MMGRIMGVVSREQEMVEALLLDFSVKSRSRLLPMI